MNPVSWTQKRGFYMSKLSYEDKNNIYQERKKENKTKEEENIHHIKALLAKLLII